MFSQKLASIVDTDLIVLPETFSTGFSMNPKFAEEENGSAVEWMKATAAENTLELRTNLARARRFCIASFGVAAASSAIGHPELTPPIRSASASGRTVPVARAALYGFFPGA